MKLAIAFAALATVVRAQVPIPSQTYFVPMPEKITLTDTFDKIKSEATTPVMGYIGIAIDTSGTVIWYDHWEDDKFEDLANLESGTGLHESTEIWGDGNCSNGVAPGSDCTSTLSSCTCDVLTSGQSIVLKAEIGNNNGQTLSDPERWDSENPFKGFYDGGDKIVASFPIAVTRGVHPTISGDKGSMMAGAVEVLETREWGTEFTAPVGYTTSTDPTWSVQDDSSTLSNDGFQHVVFYVQAGEEGTDLVFSDGATKTIGTGETYTHSINKRGETLTTSKPVQVDLITGDVGSTYELRWYSLLPTAQWSNRYISPVGDSTGKTRAIFYNPNTSTIQVKGLYKSDSKSETSVTIDAGQHMMSEFTPDGTGAEFYSAGGEPFFAMSFTDTLSGQHIYDWGFPIVPKNRLSSQALIGWGYGCTGNDCKNDEFETGDYSQSRSVVWVTPTEDADIYIDRDNNGVGIEKITVSKLECLKIVDDDNDMSGARIWAVEQNADPGSSSLVNIAVAWGQDPANSGNSDNEALDMGTVVPPFYTLRASETVTLTDDRDSNGRISPGDICTYRTMVQNVGNQEYIAGDYKFVEPAILTNLPGPRQTLVPGSGRFTYDNYSVDVSDSELTRSSGYECPQPLPARGGQNLLTFEVLIGDPADIDIAEISNAYIVEDTKMGVHLPVSANEVIYMDPSVDIQKTVTLGHVSCTTDGVELITAAAGTDVTYCYRVTNTGKSYLKDVAVTDTGVGYGGDGPFALLAPGDVVYASEFQTTIAGYKNTDATVTGIPVLVNGNDIETFDYTEDSPVTDTDPAAVNQLDIDPKINIEKTVVVGSGSCNNGELVTDYVGTIITYCYTVTNTGDTTLVNVEVTDPNIFPTTKEIPVLVIGETVVVTFEKEIDGAETETAVAVGVPADSSDTPYPGVDPVTDDDDASVGVLEMLEVLTPDINIEKTVHLGDIETCFNGQELEYGVDGTIVTYCFEVTNTGAVDLINVIVVDTETGVTGANLGSLAVGQTKFTRGPDTITGTLNSDAVVTGSTADGDVVTNSDPAGVEPLPARTCP